MAWGTVALSSTTPANRRWSYVGISAMGGRITLTKRTSANTQASTSANVHGEGTVCILYQACGRSSAISFWVRLQGARKKNGRNKTLAHEECDCEA
jgi:hypothetical protein